MTLYDHEITLITETQDETYDEIGQEIETPISTTVLCGLKSVTRNEFYSAAQNRLKPSIVFIIHAFEYNGEEKVIFEEQEYSVIRTYTTDNEEMELVCERVGANG